MKKKTDKLLEYATAHEGDYQLKDGVMKVRTLNEVWDGTTKKPAWLVEARKRIREDYGPKCKEYKRFCYACLIYEALELLEETFTK